MAKGFSTGTCRGFRGVIGALVALVVFATTARAADELTTSDTVTQHGITWTFSQPRPVGRYVNGDWWVVGPITVTGITRPSATPERDGSMVNPIPSTSRTSSHGYDSRIAGYDPALDVSTKLPNLTLAPGSSLISTISRELDNPKARPVLEVGAVLTVVAEPPAEGTFRPPYAGADKPTYSANNLQTQFLLSLAPVSGTPTLAAMEAKLEKPWIDHRLEWQGDSLHPERNMENYGGGMSRDGNDAALRLLLDDPIEAKRTLLIRFVQLGIDNYGLVANGAHWGTIGGTLGVGRKLPILFAGLMLDNADMKNVASTYNTRATFPEDGQTFYLTQAERDATRHQFNNRSDYWRPGFYDDTPLGAACWGERHYKWQTDPKWPQLPGKINYLPTTHQSTLGAALVVRLLKIEALWNHDAFLDWTDRCRAEGVGGTWGSNFARNMWEAYR